MPPDSDYPGMAKDYKGPSVDQTRKWVLWGNLLGGGWGVEYHFGYKLPQNDLVCEDWRSRDQSWDYAKIALDFFRDQKIPFADMSPNPEAVGNPEKGNQTYCLSEKIIHVLAFPDGGSCKLKLPNLSQKATPPSGPFSSLNPASTRRTNLAKGTARNERRPGTTTPQNQKP
jgi:hypothetical protein